MVAEYDRSIAFIESGKVTPSNPLQFDTCGGFPINLYVLEADNGVFVRLDDALGGHLIDIDGRKVYAIAFDESGMYVGRLFTDFTSIGRSSVNGDPMTISIGSDPATPLQDVTGPYEESYFGKVAGPLGQLRFVPASQSPAAKLDYLRPRPGE